jgi:hypothetical protein
MRPVRVLLCAAALLLVVLPQPGQAATTERHVHLTYSPGTTATETAGDEDRVTAVADDAVSAVVRITVAVTSPTGATSTVEGCNRVSKVVTPGSRVTVTTSTGSCNDGRLAIATQGTIELVFHPRPKPVRWISHIAPAADRWALLIGIRDYAGNTHSTVGGDGDVTAIHGALLASGWRNDHIRIVEDSAATADGIRRAIRWLVDHSSPSTFSLLHYSGHVCIASRGPCASGHTYLWGHDNRFVAEDELASLLQPLQGHAWLDVAGCEAGAFDQGFHSATHLFTASSRASETSYEDPSKKQSIWVSQVWDEGYNQGHADDAGIAHHATMRQMAAYGAQRAPVITSNGSGGPQHPVWVGGNPSWRLASPPGR